jgi:phosphotransferase system HPr-like phosphotransfer protein
VLMLAANQGTELHASADGVDEEVAMNAIEELFSTGFGEPEPESST